MPCTQVIPPDLGEFKKKYASFITPFALKYIVLPWFGPSFVSTIT
jgi:hypothetical protein